MLLPESDQPRQRFEAPPTSAQLSVLFPAPRAAQLSYSVRGDVYEVAIAPRSVWLVLPGLVWFGLLLALAPLAAPLWGGQFMGWGRWLAMIALIWAVGLPVALVLLSWIIQRKNAGDSVVVADATAGKLYLPCEGRTIETDRLFQVVEVIRWAEDEGRWQPVVQTSLVVVPPEGGFEVVPLVTQIQPGRFAMPLANRLAELLTVPVMRVQLGAEQSRLV